MARTVFTIIVFLIWGCSEKPKSYEAIVGEAQEVNISNGKSFIVDVSKSIVTWVGTKPTGRHTGTFDLKEGNIIVSNDNRITSGVFVIKMNSITVLDLNGEDKEKLTKHLKSPDFFDLNNYPESKFEITNVEQFMREDFQVLEEDTFRDEFMGITPTHIVTGNFSMRGKTLSIKFPAEIYISNNLITAEARFNIDRTRWGVSWGDENFASKLRDAFAHNTVNVGFEIVASTSPAM